MWFYSFKIGMFISCGKSMKFVLCQKTISYGLPVTNFSHAGHPNVAIAVEKKPLQFIKNIQSIKTHEHSSATQFENMTKVH